MDSNKLVFNISGESPHFFVKPLEAGHTYRAKVTSFNSRGRSHPSKPIILTLEKAEMHKSKDGSTANYFARTCYSSLPSMVPLPPSVFIMAVVGGVVLVSGALLLSALWWIKKKKTHAHSDSTHSQIVLKDNNPDLISKGGE
ncbi:hypothetical protein SK128_006833 [Halocaridina rubra]|uniref:Fibronectin type-III domain-containing protein n=1 Tax=Halocaridina rubra TaxID=373956 RepID=A0AAN8WPT9_HALRR